MSASPVRARAVGEPRWRDVAVLRAIHLLLAAEHPVIGRGFDADRLSRALRSARALMAGGGAGPARLAAAYAAAIAAGRPLARGNAALALAAALAMLRASGRLLAASETETAAVFRLLEAHEIDERALEAWLRRNSTPA